MIYKHDNTKVKGAAKWGAKPGKLKKGEKLLNLNHRDEEGNELFTIGIPGKIKGDERRVKGSQLPLNFFTIHEIRPELDRDLKETGNTRIIVRFHSTKQYCAWTFKEHKAAHGGIFTRDFIYLGQCKSQAELESWLTTTPDLYDTTGTVCLHGAKKV